MSKNVVLLVRREGLGFTEPADREFGVEMLDKLFHALEGQTDKPRAICFYTEGVKAACEGAPTVAGLQLLEGMGVRLLLCKSCLEYYGLSDKVAVGQVGGMHDIVRCLLEADQVISV